jgi:antitoxin Phd
MTDTWKLQDAKARFSELVRRARAGKPQQVTIHGREAVVVVDPERFEIRAKPKREERTLADFIERSKKYRGAIDSLKIDRKWNTESRDKRREIFDGSFLDEDKT